MERQKNDDTKTKLGDLFHYLIVMEHCLDLKPGDTIYVETFGDISIESAGSSINMEIKNHLQKHLLSSRHGDFWNSLKNWVTYHEQMDKFKKLLLVSTSVTDSKSIFNTWNELDEDERYALLKNEGQQIKKKESGFREWYTDIFLKDEKTIRKIIAKLELQLNEVNVMKRKAKIKQHSIFNLIEDQHADSFIYELLGSILMKPAENDGTWEITYDQFKKHATDIRDKHSKQSRPLPTTFSKDKPKNVKGYMNREFVKQILEIECDTEDVEEAVISYWRMNQTYMMHFDDDPIYMNDIYEYKSDLNKRLSRMRKQSKKKCSADDHCEKSQDFFQEVMLLEAMPFGSINPNRDFFQQGIVHSIVDDGGLKWNLKK